jgi:hypothetical protein
MGTVYVGGKKVGSWAEAEMVFAEAARTQAVEFRDEHDRVIATTVPTAGPDPDWVAAITPEEIERLLAGPFLTLEEYRRQTRQ